MSHNSGFVLSLVNDNLDILIFREQTISRRHYHYHHHHGALSAQISLTLSCHPSLSSIASGRSSRLHPVSAQSCCMLVLAGYPALGDISTLNGSSLKLVVKFTYRGSSVSSTETDINMQRHGQLSIGYWSYGSQT